MKIIYNDTEKVELYEIIKPVSRVDEILFRRSRDLRSSLLLFHRRRHFQPTHRYFAEMNRPVRVHAYLFTGIFVKNGTMYPTRDKKDETRIQRGLVREYSRDKRFLDADRTFVTCH